MKRLELKVTYKCTDHCRHCIYCSTDRQGTFLTTSDVERIIRQTRPTGCVLFTGGEASLAPEVVVHGMGFAKIEQSGQRF
ncbi:MAG: FO synthase subunit 1 [Syntrophorhabdus sp. PtaB.Bin006]|nr:MAG: FO synthase subunit 1 [Syntrophorhabdus sp. PtaB.Bin006]